MPVMPALCALALNRKKAAIAAKPNLTPTSSSYLVST
jgi:hypothetical protein